MSVLPAEIYGQLQSKIENSRKTVSISISDNSLKNGQIFTNNDKENAHLSKSDENVPPEISDRVPNAAMESKRTNDLIDQENEYLSISDEKVSTEISDKWKHASFDLDDYAKGIKPTLKYHCLICNKKYEDVLVLNHHFKITHETENLFKCKICYKTFQVEQNLKQHVTLYHDKRFSPEIKLYQCSKCPNFFDKESSLKNHVSLMH